MILLAREWFGRRCEKFFQTRFGCLVRIFTGRMFRGSGETGAGELDLGLGAIAILLAMPGTLASLLMFAEYGSLTRFLRGERTFDPFTATIPDEYFFIVLSLVVTGAAVLWRWDAIFLDRRDYANLVPLPLSLRAIFLANLCAILSLAGLLTLIVNAVSLVLFPMAVAGSQPSLSLLFHFAAGHAVAVFLASVFSFCAVFALAGLLMALLPSALFRRISLPVRFLGAVGLIMLLASSFAVTDWLKGLSIPTARWVAILPPISFLGIARTVWGRGNDVFDVTMTRGALAALGLAVLTAIVGYSLSFRRSFIRIPEIDAGPVPGASHSFSPLAPFHKLTLHLPSQRACYQFVARSLLRSAAHLQVVLGFAAVGLVVSTEALTSVPLRHPIWTSNAPPVEFLSIPFVMSYCLLIGLRLAFEIPMELRANWIFRLWLDPEQGDARVVARRVLLAFSLPWLGPAAFVTTLVFWGWTSAVLHTLLWMAFTAVLAEILIIHFRKIPFTYPYPTFESNAPVRFLAYLAGFFFFTKYLPDLDQGCLLSPERTLWFVPLFGAIFAGLYVYRRQMLDMDKRLIFEDDGASGF